MIDYNEIAQAAIKEIADEWNAQGHDLTGAFREGMTYKIEGNTITIIDTTDSGYGKILDDGVKAERIVYPYARKRIEGLSKYAKLRMGASDKDAVSIAFAIATKHAKEGMPLPSSVRYSKTGRRTKFVEDAAKRIDKIVKKLTDGYFHNYKFR